MSEQDLTPDQLEQLREQLASVSAGDVVAEAALSLIALAYVRLGIPPEQHARFRDLDDARLLVDALGGMLVGHRGPPGRPRAEPPRRPGQPAHGLRRRVRPPGGPPRRRPEPEPEEPEDSGILRPPSGLWVPGQD